MFKGVIMSNKKAITSVSEFVEAIDKSYYSRMVVERVTLDALNGYGSYTTFYVSIYIITNICRKCGWLPAILHEHQHDQACKGKHSWDKQHEVPVGFGEGMTEGEAFDNFKVYKENLPISFNQRFVIAKLEAIKRPTKLMFDK